MKDFVGGRTLGGDHYPRATCGYSGPSGVARAWREQEQSLGNWVRLQRAKYLDKGKGLALTETWRARLDMLPGWSWAPVAETGGAHAAQWEAQYVAL